MVHHCPWDCRYEPTLLPTIRSVLPSLTQVSLMIILNEMTILKSIRFLHFSLLSLCSSSWERWGRFQLYVFSFFTLGSIQWAFISADHGKFSGQNGDLQRQSIPNHVSQQYGWLLGVSRQFWCVSPVASSNALVSGGVCRRNVSLFPIWVLPKSLSAFFQRTHLL